MPTFDDVAVKSNPAFANVVMYGNAAQPHQMPKNFRSYAIEGYRGNDTIYKVVSYITTNAASIPPKLYTDDTKQKEITKHALLDKLKRPNPEQNGVNYRKSVIGHYLVAGNSFQYAIRKGTSGPPDELWVLEPHKVKILPSSKRGVVGYNYDAFDNMQPPINPIPAENVSHMKTWAPDDPLWGVSPIEVGAIQVDQQTAAKKWNLALLQNSAKMSGAFTTPIILAPNDRSKIEDKVNEKFAGFRNAGRIPVLDGGLAWQSMSVTPREMDWLPSIQYNAGSLANLYNIPPPLIGDTSASTYNNLEQAKAASYTEEIFPVLDELYSLWTMWLVPMYSDLCDNKGNPVAYLYYDKESVEVVQEVIQAKKTAIAERANTAWMNGEIMLDEAREMQDLPPLPNGMGRVFRLGAILVPADKLMDYAKQSLTTPAAPPPAQAEPLSGATGQEPPPQAKPNDAENKPVNTENKPQPENTVQDEEKQTQKSMPVYSVKVLDLTTKEEKDAYADTLESIRKKYESLYAKKIAAYFEQERKAVMQAIATAVAISALDQSIEDAINAQSSKLQKILLSLYEDVAVDVGALIADLLGIENIANDFVGLFGNTQIKRLIQIAISKIKQIIATTLDKIKSLLSNIDDDDDEDDDDWQDMIGQINNLYQDEFIPTRSGVIASDEVVFASNYASYQIAIKSGRSLNKVWTSMGDNRVRNSHDEADGQEVGLNEAFDVGAYQMMYPKDDSLGAPAKEICGCRCYLTYKTTNPDKSGIDSDEEKRLSRDDYRRFMSEVLV